MNVDRQEQPPQTGYLPPLRSRAFYRATFVLCALPVTVQAALFVWLWTQLTHGEKIPGLVILTPALLVVSLVAAHLRLHSTLGRMHARTARFAGEQEARRAVDEAILALFRMPRNLLLGEVALSFIAMLPLSICAHALDPRLSMPLAIIPACVMVMVIPPYLQTELWEVRRIVRFLPPPTDPAVIAGHMRKSYLMGGMLVLIPTGISLFEVYELAHVMLLRLMGSQFNIVRHLEPLWLLTGMALLGALMGITWWIGSRAGREIETISRFFEDAFRKPGGRMSTVTSMPAPGSFTIREIVELRSAAEKLASRLQQIRGTKVEQIEALERAQRVKTVFLASMSHDLKSPLNSIIGFSELLLRGIEGDLPEPQRENMRLIHASGEELLGLINNILDSARLEAGKLELHKEWTPSVELVSNVVRTGMQQIGTKRIVFESEIQPGLPPVFVDPHRISQAIGNLISNAIKFMEEGKVTLRAYIHKTGDDPQRKFLRIDVQDTGEGIREEYRERIFEAFQQIDLSYSRRASGMGLGLTLTKNLVDLHEGKLTLSSELGKGSTFSISLPLED